MYGGLIPADGGRIARVATRGFGPWAHPRWRGAHRISVRSLSSLGNSDSTSTCDDVHDGPPECLEAVEAFVESAFGAECHHLIEPGHHEACPVASKVQDLGGFGVDLLGEPLGFESVVQDRGVLPEELVECQADVDVDRGDRDLALGFDPAQHVRPDEDRIAEADGLLPELGEHDRGAVAHDHDPHGVVCGRPDGAVNGACAADQRLNHRGRPQMSERPAGVCRLYLIRP